VSSTNGKPWPGDELPDVAEWLTSIENNRRWAEERERQRELWVRARYPELTRGTDSPDGPLGAIKLAFAGMYADWELALPDDAVAVRQAGAVPNERGWQIRFRFGRADGREYMDVFASHRMNNDRLYRFFENGTVEMLGASLDIIANLNEETRDRESEFRRLVREH